jgi:hypothetical protein
VITTRSRRQFPRSSDPSRGYARALNAHCASNETDSSWAWLELLQRYLPQRYQAATAHVVDSQGNFSQQIDVVVFDRQYSPFIFNYQGQTIIPAESVYAAFEAKQAINAELVGYAQNKVASVRRLKRTSLPIPHAGGTFPPKPLIPILGGILAFESDWSPAFGQPLADALATDDADGVLDFGCVAAHGYFFRDQQSGAIETHIAGKPATGFLFRLISQLQFSGTVPMIDVGPMRGG